MSIKIRIQAMEKMMIRPDSPFSVDPLTGWWQLGGGKRAAGILTAPPVMTEEAWIAAGKDSRETASQAI